MNTGHDISQSRRPPGLMVLRLRWSMDRRTARGFRMPAE